MSARLIWLCLIAVILTLTTLLEAIRDYRAIKRRKRDGNLRNVAVHAIIIESIRVAKVIALGVGVYLAFTHKAVANIIMARNWIMTCVAIAMGVTSLAELLFRHRMMKRLRVEYGKGEK